MWFTDQNIKLPEIIVLLKILVKVSMISTLKKFMIMLYAWETSGAAKFAADSLHTAS